MAYRVQHIPLKGAFAGGAVVAFIAIGIGVAVGSVSAGEAASLLESSLPTIRFMASAVMTAAATTLALLLTLLGVTAGSDQQLDKSFYHTVRTVARLTVWAFAASVVLLGSLVIPFSENIEIPRSWYIGLYYAFIAVSALCGGLLVTIALAIFSIIKHLISTFWLESADNGQGARDAEEQRQQQERPSHTDGQQREGKARGAAAAES